MGAAGNAPGAEEAGGSLGHACLWFVDLYCWVHWVPILHLPSVSCERNGA